MSTAERDRFLSGPHVGILAVEQPDDPPVAVPVWYDYSPQRGIWFLTGAASRKADLLRRAGRATLCVQDEAPPYSYVSVEAVVSSIEPADRERDLRPIARRYLGQKGGDAYVARSAGDESILVVLRPQVWRTVDYSKAASD